MTTINPQPPPISAPHKLITSLSVILLLIPLITWGIAWHWQHDQPYRTLDLILYAITETGSAPVYALIVSFILATLLALICKKSHFVVIFLSVLLLQGSSQLVKTVLKQAYKEPRPYMSYVQEQGLNLDSFYQQKRSERRLRLAPIFAQDNHTPNWLKNHWQHEVGYSFPSGHTAFAVCWVLIFAGFLVRESHGLARGALAAITFWACLMLISRMRLGMHYPIDLFVSTIFVFFLNQVYFGWINKHNYENKLIALFNIITRRFFNVQR